MERGDWRVAIGLSVIPGLGQLYNRQLGKGLFFLVTTVLTLGPAVLLITVGERVGHVLLEGHQFAGFLAFAFGSIVVFLALLVLGLFLWASAAGDARRTALAAAAEADGGSGRWWFFRL